MYTEIFFFIHSSILLFCSLFCFLKIKKEDFCTDLQSLYFSGLTLRVGTTFLFFKYLFFLLHFYLIWNKRNPSILTSYIITSSSSKSIFTECLIFQASLYKILSFYKVRCPYLLLLFSRHLTKQFYLHFLLF